MHVKFSLTLHYVLHLTTWIKKMFRSHTSTWNMFQHIRHKMTVGRPAFTVTAITLVSKSRRLDFELLPVQSGFDFQEAEYMMILPSISSLSAKQKKSNQKITRLEMINAWLQKHTHITCTCTMVIQKKIHSLVYYLESLKIFAYFNTLLEGIN